MKAKQITQEKSRYVLTHALANKTSPFDNWVDVCNYALDIAEIFVRNQKTYKSPDEQRDKICVLADEIIETAQELQENDEAVNWA